MQPSPHICPLEASRRELALLGEMPALYRELDMAILGKRWEDAQQLQGRLESLKSELTSLATTLGPLAGRESSLPELEKLWQASRGKAEAAALLCQQACASAGEARAGVGRELAGFSRKRQMLSKYRSPSLYNPPARFTSRSV